jgi:hypothetical protein
MCQGHGEGSKIVASIDIREPRSKTPQIGDILENFGALAYTYPPPDSEDTWIKGDLSLNPRVVDLPV